MDEQIVSASLLSVTQSIAVFTALTPPLHEIRKSDLTDPATVQDVRLAEITATALVASIGLTASMMVKSPLPAGVAICAAAGLVIMYESVLATPPKEGATK